MPAQENLKIEQQFTKRRDNILLKFTMIAYISGGTVIFLPMYQKTLFTTILAGIFLVCFASFWLVRLYYHFKCSKIYAIESDLVRKEWHYLYTKKQWKIRNIHVKAGNIFLCLLLTFPVLFLGFKSIPPLLFNSVLAVSISVLMIIFISLTLNYSAYKASLKERKRLENEEKERFASYDL